MSYSMIIFEISGTCQGQCTWCVRKRYRAGQVSSRFVQVGEFQDAVARMQKLGLIGQDTVIHLYNWGEPLLHPQLPQILEFLAASRVRFALSTNAARPFPQIDRQILSWLESLKVSLPGFSQESFERISGLSFTKVTSNVEWLCRDLRRKGLSPEDLLSKVFTEFHIYRFNLQEREACRAWCEELGIRFTQVVAFINDLERAMAFLRGDLDEAERTRAASELYLDHVPALAAGQPADYACPQHGILVLDEYLNVLTCCGVYKDHPDYAAASLFDDDLLERIKDKKRKAVCRECMALGTPYWGHNPLEEPEEESSKLEARRWK